MRRSKLEKAGKPSPENASTVEAKLPKPEVHKFQGTYLDWMSLWNQFETEIDKAKLTQVSKFSYLKELLVPSVRSSINGLPFMTEGYERAKTILKTDYGKSSEVGNAHMQCIIGLRPSHGSHPARIHDFYGKLTTHMQVPETMGKLKEIRCFALSIKWDKGGACLVCCNGEDHRASECKKIPDLNTSRRILSERKLCFNYTGTRHQAQQCRSKNTCQLCGNRHHTSIGDQLPGNNQMMMVTGGGTVIYPVVVIVVDGNKCRAPKNTGAGSSYASAALVGRLNKRQVRIKHGQIEMMFCSTTLKAQSY